MSVWEALAILLAGIGAGGINAVVGSGTLFTFPVLLALGYPPVTASISNSVGLSPGAITGAIGYRRELKGQGRRAARLAVMSCAGAITGGVLLLNLPSEVFELVVPVLITLACVLIIVQPRISAWVRSRRGAEHRGRGPLLPLGVYGAGVYGGYFAAAQGIVLISVLGTALDEDVQRINAIKNVLTSVVNATAAVFYTVFAQPEWPVVGLIAAGSVLGGYVGARLGRRLKPFVLRGLIVTVGLMAVVHLVIEQF
ncbi:sulfite exporter TauE/SafE family protein [Streptomonospora sp. S1-112]|uniref:Probable membrane transporter protein n=1 Tax=Streptomonospora mangrovi TaxID=2883123 RepID=A0A9X3NM72_9ACTN|nr:sulfite exporter TauE/SafE family protein [Streptomonospora mangrovi]MDA0565868.1 sulfite exporter TauE/SafE family protein [Streptomonospora mangrovi]